MIFLYQLYTINKIILMQRQFFQNETKFEVGKYYQTLNIDNPYFSKCPREFIDEYGIIRSNTIKYVGKYINSVNSGFNDSRTRHDTFELDGKLNIIQLAYDGSTRFREVDCDTKEPIVLHIPLPELKTK